MADNTADDREPLLAKDTTTSSNKAVPQAAPTAQHAEHEHGAAELIDTIRHAAAAGTLKRPINYVTRSFAFAGENRLAFAHESVTTKRLVKETLAEFWGMILFVYFGCGSVVSTGMFLVDDSGKPPANNVARILPIATAFGISIIVLVFNLGHISGGHINPAVTWALWLMGKITPARMVLYWIAQFSGAVVGAALLLASTSNISTSTLLSVREAGYPPFQLGAVALSPALSPANGLLFEIMGTMFLIFTILYSAIDQRAFAASNLLPLPIGFTVWICHVTLVPWTGCGINPARVFGPAVVNSFAGVNTWGSAWWIYWIGPLVGATIAVVLTRLAWEGTDSPNRQIAVVKTGDVGDGSPHSKTSKGDLPMTTATEVDDDDDDEEQGGGGGAGTSNKKEA